MNGRGRFVVFEGIDASGKSSHARRVAEDRGALFTFEPGDSELGAEIRRWFLDAAAPMAPETESLLVLADRAHHVRSRLRPALDQGVDVVSDRFFASTLAYQGYGRGLDLDELWSATELAIGDLRPDLTILIDVTVDVADERRARDHRDRFESAARDFHERVRAGYLALAQRYDDWVVVDGARDVDVVAAEVDAVLDRLTWRA